MKWPSAPKPTPKSGCSVFSSAARAAGSRPTAPIARARSCASVCAQGKLGERMVEVDVQGSRVPRSRVSTASGNREEMDVSIKDMLGGLFGGRTKKRKMRVGEAIVYLVQEEEQKLLDMDLVTRTAIERVESQRHHLPGRSRQDRGPRGRSRAGCQPRGRAARHPADRRGHDGEHALTVSCGPITFCSSPPGRSMFPNRAI